MLFPSSPGICPGEHIFLRPAVPLASTINPQPIAAFHTPPCSNLAYSNTVDLSTSLWFAKGPNLLEKPNTSVIKVLGSLFIAFSCAGSLPSPAAPFSEENTQTAIKHLPSPFLRLLKNSELVTFSIGVIKDPHILQMCAQNSHVTKRFFTSWQKSVPIVFCSWARLCASWAWPGPEVEVLKYPETGCLSEGSRSLFQTKHLKFRDTDLNRTSELLALGCSVMPFYWWAVGAPWEHRFLRLRHS